MDKKKVVDAIVEYLAEELKVIEAAAASSLEAATHEDARSENEYDTRAVEAGYLAGAQAKRADEIRAQLLMYKHLPLRDFSGPSEVVCAAALVELELKGRRAFYFVAPSGGGLVTTIDGKPVQVITPASPIGDALMGHKTGDLVEVESRDSVREYKVISVR